MLILGQTKVPLAPFSCVAKDTSLPGLTNWFDTNFSGKGVRVKSRSPTKK